MRIVLESFPVVTLAALANHRLFSHHASGVRQCLLNDVERYSTFVAVISLVFGAYL